ncbi:hypothetical protein [Arthrobacter globiformis]|uniref:hypothetical protein n=1 Tax=Arthrobacter globiformis TaxID=1665 RepID=UPI00278A5FD7|nr:hypothetical protein [Arthrobacter globiformis]MDQ0863498.1 hypothetical protein [Arthrobacter globiformis]
MNAQHPRRKTPESIHASMLPSACTLDAVSTAQRVDPYWDELWVPGSQANWTTAYGERYRRDHGAAPGVPPRLLMDDGEHLRLLTANRGRIARQNAWSVMHAYRTVTAEQLAAFTGCLKFLDYRSAPLAASFSADLVDLGWFPVPRQYSGIKPGRNILYRPAATDVYKQLVEPTLTGPESLTVTGGQPWSSGGQYDRHNVLAAELAIRASEWLPIGTVLGETFASVDLLLGSGLGKTVKRPDNRRADGVIVRTDGLRIAYEITATASRGLESKVRRWAQALAAHPMETSGLTVVFIAAPHPRRKDGTNPLTAIRNAISDVVLREFPGTGTDSPAARIGVASWGDYFPARHELSESFFRLEADFAVGHGKGAAKWIPRGLLDEQKFEPWTATFDATAVIDNAPLLGATPYWLREAGKDYTELIGSPIERAGEPVPHPAPAKPKTAKGRPLGTGVGRARDTQLPRRLRIIA